MKIPGLIFFISGLLLLVYGTTTSLLFGLAGALFLAGAAANYYEGRIKRTYQVLILVLTFIFGAAAAYIGLGWNEGWKRSCAPEGDCSARHDFNSLEKLDQQLFHYYDYLSDKPNN